MKTKTKIKRIRYCKCGNFNLGIPLPCLKCGKPTPRHIDKKEPSEKELLVIELKKLAKDMTSDKSSVVNHYWGYKIEEVLATGEYTPPAIIKACDGFDKASKQIAKRT